MWQDVRLNLHACGCAGCTLQKALAAAHPQAGSVVGRAEGIASLLAGGRGAGGEVPDCERQILGTLRWLAGQREQRVQVKGQKGERERESLNQWRGLLDTPSRVAGCGAEDGMVQERG